MKKWTLARLIFGGTILEMSGGLWFVLFPTRIAWRNLHVSSSNSYTRKPVCNRVLDKCSIEGEPPVRVAAVSWTKLSWPFVQHKLLTYYWFSKSHRNISATMANDREPSSTQSGYQVWRSLSNYYPIFRLFFEKLWISLPSSSTEWCWGD